MSDVEALATLAAETFTANFGHLYEPRYLARHLQRSCSADYFAQQMAEGVHLFVAKRNDDVLGYVKAGKVGLPVTHDAADGEIHRLYVADGNQGAGVGHALMKAALQQLTSDGARTLWLGVWEHNIRAQHFYARYGFRKVGDYFYRVGPHADREWIMRRD